MACEPFHNDDRYASDKGSYIKMIVILTKKVSIGDMIFSSRYYHEIFTKKLTLAQSVGKPISLRNVVLYGAN